MGYPVVAMNIDGALRDVDEDHPNAQLIAAAPDMYDALKRVADLRDLLQYPDNINEERYGEAKAINDMITDVNKAIAKAEGKEEQR